MKSKLLSLLFVCFFAGSVFACEHPSDYTPIAKRPSDALLYEISGCGQPTSYLLGTFHSDSPKLQPIIDHARPFLLSSASLWVEIDSKPSDSATSMQHITFPQSHEGLKSLIGESLFTEAVQKIAPVLGMAETTLDRFRPWALALLVQYPPSEANGIIFDAKLQHLAAGQGIPVKGLETLESQYQIFHNMPESMQIDFLASTLEDFDTLAETTRKLRQHYIEQKLQSLHQDSMELLAKTATQYADLSQYLQTNLIEKRNIGMARTLSKQLRNSSFIAVGALHLTGEKGLLNLLEKKGLQIRPISAPNTP